MAASYLCFDVGGTFVKYGVFDELGVWQKKGQFATVLASVDGFFAPLVALCEQLQKETPLTAIGLSFPGFVDNETGVAVFACAINVLKEKRIAEEVGQGLTFSCPILVENDANCAALAEMQAGAGRNYESFVLVTLGTGVGGAIVAGGQLLHGDDFRAGEFGMMVTDIQGSGYQTLHDLASTSSLVARYKKAHGMPASAEVSGVEIFAREDEPVTAQVLTEWSRYVALLLFNLAVTLNPQSFLIGGGISQNPALYPWLEKALAQNPFWQDFQTTIQPCHYHNDAGLIGALSLIINKGAN